MGWDKPTCLLSTPHAIRCNGQKRWCHTQILSSPFGCRSSSLASKASVKGTTVICEEGIPPLTAFETRTVVWFFFPESNSKWKKIFLLVQKERNGIAFQQVFWFFFFLIIEWFRFNRYYTSFVTWEIEGQRINLILIL